jgi:hypothetical protein
VGVWIPSCHYLYFDDTYRFKPISYHAFPRRGSRRSATPELALENWTEEASAQAL